jgi:hypothetical protein
MICTVSPCSIHDDTFRKLLRKSATVAVFMIHLIYHGIEICQVSKIADADGPDGLSGKLSHAGLAVVNRGGAEIQRFNGLQYFVKEPSTAFSPKSLNPLSQGNTVSV